jgi:hypothetical protein
MEEEGLLNALSQAAIASGRGLINPLSGSAAGQVDLNDPTQLGDLEDAGLMSHMDEARAQLADQERASALLVESDLLSEMEIDGRSALSDLMTLLREQRAALANARDSIFLHASNAAKIAAGVTPHGYPQVDSLKPAAPPKPAAASGIRTDTGSLVMLSSRINEAGNEIERVCSALEAAESTLTRARRSVEGVMTGRGQRCTHYENAWHELSKTLQLH